MPGCARLLLGIALWAMAAGASAAVARLHDTRLWAHADKTRVVLELSADTQPDIFMVANPLRLVIDLPHTRRAGRLAGDTPASGLVRDIRSGVHHGSGLRIVLDLAAMVTAKSFMLLPAQGHRYRLVVDLYPQSGPGDRGAATAAPAGTGRADATDEALPSAARGDAAGALTATAAKSPPAPAAAPAHDIVVAIDPGHGGKDPGARGPDGLLEKNVTLAIARRLKRMIDDQPHMRAILTRRGDYYVGLRQRMVIARRHKADFFVSIHCDASPDGSRASGASVYALSAHGATSEHARWLAQRENAANLVGGVDLKDKNTKLASFVLDLSQNASIDASMDAGGRVLAQLDNLGSLHKSRVQQAGFMVLKSPDIPSILVETNFISNSRTEHELATPVYQTELAAALLRGIKGYFARYRPDTHIAAGARHRVRPGDTLAAIAAAYGVSPDALRDDNPLNDNVIQVGRMLRIPAPRALRTLASRE